MSLTDDLETLGVPEVRKRLSEEGFGQPGSQTFCSVQEWLRGKAESGTAARDAEFLAAAKEANRIAALQAKSASRSATWAKWSAITAVIAAIIAAIAAITTIITLIKTIK
jgi:hypothetical protein